MSMAAKSSGEDVLQRLQALAEHFRTSNSSQSPTLPPPDPAAARLTNRAAVLICLFLSDIGELRVILTKRASTLSSHSGQSRSETLSHLCEIEIALKNNRIGEGLDD